MQALTPNLFLNILAASIIGFRRECIAEKYPRLKNITAASIVVQIRNLRKCHVLKWIDNKEGEKCMSTRTNYRYSNAVA